VRKYHDTKFLIEQAPQIKQNAILVANQIRPSIEQFLLRNRTFFGGFGVKKAVSPLDVDSEPTTDFSFFEIDPLDNDNEPTVKFQFYR